MAKPKMCSGSRNMEMIASPKDAPKRVKCPKCGRKVKPRLYDCHHNIPGAIPCWHYSIPPHKIKKWWKRKNK